MKKFGFLLITLVMSAHTMYAQSKVDASSLSNIAIPSLNFISGIEDQFSSVTELIMIGHIWEEKEYVLDFSANRRYSAILTSTANVIKATLEVYRVESDNTLTLIHTDTKGEDPIAAVVFNTDNRIKFVFKLKVFEYDSEEKRGEFALCFFKELPKP